MPKDKLYPQYMIAIYRDYIKSQSKKELLTLIDMIVEHLERKGYIVFGKIVVRDE